MIDFECQYDCPGSKTSEIIDVDDHIAATDKHDVALDPIKAQMCDANLDPIFKDLIRIKELEATVSRAI